jgi:membrane protease YdiL (CAAX protease family)
LIGGAVAVVAIAPVCEEIFFRGLLYRVLRLRMPVLAAAVIDGVIFGAVHGSLVILPVLAVLGVIFCLVYERTGSLFPTIAMHSVNNVLAFGSTAKHGWPPALAVGALVLLACLIVPRLLPPSPRPIPA